jgi:hypothetical protein
MTRTEDRLTDALGASAEFVTRESLRRLIPPAIERSRPGARVWLAASAAAAAVLLVVGGSVAIGTRPSGTGPRSASAEPSYRVEVEQGKDLVVRSTATGKVTDSLSPALGAKGFSGTTVAKASQAPVFAVAYVASGNWTDIDKFVLSKTGHIVDVGRVAKIQQFVNVSLAMSPDGSKIALEGAPVQGPTSGQQVIEVFDRLTGSHSIWAAGTTGGQSQLGIASLSWQATGRSLIYLADRCVSGGFSMLNAVCPGQTGAGPVKGPYLMRLPVAGKQGLLPGGKIDGKRLRTLDLTRGVRAFQAIADPADAGRVFLVEQTHDRVIVDKINARGNSALERIFRSKAEPVLNQGLTASFSADGSGSYFLVNVNKGTFYGWVHAGTFHQLDAARVDWQAGAW